MAKIKRIRDRTYLVIGDARLIAELVLYDDGCVNEWRLIDYNIPGKVGQPTIVAEHEHEDEAVVDLRLCYPQQIIYQTSYLLGTV